MSTIVIADPQPFIRDALHQRLAAIGHVIVGECGDGRDALTLVQRTHPDLVILELELPRLSGLELIRRLRADDRKQKLLVFTNLSGPYYQGLCLQAGASGFVHKGATLEELDEAVRMTLGGRLVFPAEVRQSASEHGPTLSPDAEIGEKLTPRELTVLQYLAHGFRVKDIAHELAISDRTVSTYKTRLLEKTQTDSLVDLVEVARARGLLAGGGAKTPVDSAASLGSDDTLAELFELLPTAVALRDAEGRLLACNSSFLQTHGKTREEVLGTRIFQSGLVEPEAAELAYQEYLAGVATGKTFSLIVPTQRNGQRRIFRMIGVPLSNEAGALGGVMTSFVDITEHEQHVEQLQEAKAFLEGLQISRNALLLLSGKELIAELDGVRTLIAAAREGNTDEVLLAEVDAGVLTIREKVEILLEAVRLERGAALMVPQSMELNRLTREAIEHSRAGADFVPFRKECWGWIDPNRYRQMVNTLIAYFARMGLPRLRIEASATSLPHGELTWQLTFTAPAGENVQKRLEDHASRPRVHLARHLCRLLGGTLSIGSPDRPELAGLIQIKLARGSSRNDEF